jgi:GTPase
VALQLTSTRAGNASHAGSSGRVDVDPRESLDELAQLAATAGADVIATHLQSRSRAEAATLLGVGRLEEIAAQAELEKADVVIFDNNLSPTQLRNLEKLLKIRVLDRTQLILDIFAARARTREGQLQVELAQLEYILPRLTGRGAAMSRLGGGIGTRGPGETKLEMDRRKIAKRIKKLTTDLEKVRNTRTIQRQQRQSVPLATISLVGYTNAGKSTLFNRLTGADVTADSRMFATLDPTVRQVKLPSKRQVLLSDTVGFIRNLPTTLVKAFRATLEEVAESSLLLHVVDASSAEAPDHYSHVLEVLREIGVEATPQILVLNKADRIADPNATKELLAERILGHSRDQSVEMQVALVSGLSGTGTDRVLALIEESLQWDAPVEVTLTFPAGDGAQLALLHRVGRVDEVTYLDDQCQVKALVPKSWKSRLQARATM